jgi:hypothetical protein
MDDTRRLLERQAAHKQRPSTEDGGVALMASASVTTVVNPGVLQRPTRICVGDHRFIELDCD